MAALQQRRPAELDRYLLDGERIVTAVHQHWGKVAEPVASALAGLVVALWVDAIVAPSVGVVSTVIWWLWFALVGRMLFLLAEWRHDWFVATDRRLLLFYGFVTRKVSMMPLMKVTDMSYERSIPGRLLGYGRFVMESAGQEQALHKVNWVPRPDDNYRAICAEIFRASDRKSPVDEAWDAEGSLPDPYAAWDDPISGPSAAGAAADTDTLYRSPDLRARDRSADTGPLPIRSPRDANDD